MTKSILVFGRRPQTAVDRITNVVIVCICWQIVHMPADCNLPLSTQCTTRSHHTLDATLDATLDVTLDAALYTPVTHLRRTVQRLDVPLTQPLRT